MEQVFFTSDTHFYHRTILTIGNGRPWDTVEDMNEGLIANWNSVVRPQDRIYHLGDFSFGNKEQTLEILGRLNGHLHIVRGNHDKTLDQALKAEPDLVDSFQSYKELKINDKRLVLFHFPILSWHQMHYGSWHLHGHCHGNLTFHNGAMLDVGVDIHDFTPIEFAAVVDRLVGIPPQSWDHHEPK